MMTRKLKQRDSDNPRQSLKVTAMRLLATMVAGLLLAQPQIALAATANELFADGNRLFRDDLYWAALLRYEQAAEAGMNTPLLQYNIGIAHYKAKQYDRARASLLRASQYAALQAVSHYNLGLVAYRRGDISEAARWFRNAEEQETRKDISRLARRALAEINDEKTVAVLAAAESAERKAKRSPADFDFRLRVGAGFDDNVYRTPSSSYVDFADPTLPLIDPVIQSGSFVPVSLRAKYQVNSYENESFFVNYQFGGNFYQDVALKEADEYLHQIAFGTEYRKSTEGRERRVYGAFKYWNHKESYYDPDTGVGRTVNGVDISDRMSYQRYGPEFWIKESFGPLSIGARVKGQLWNYKTVGAVPEYDHEFWLVGLNSEYRFSRSSLLRLKGEYYTRRYSDRPAYNLDGSQPAGNPTVRYDYLELGLTARQRLTQSMWVDLSYVVTDREDRHVGYNNFQRNELELEFHLTLNQRFDLEAFGRLRIFDYENAFAFNNPAAGRKELDTLDVGLEATYIMTNSLELAAEYFLRDVTSNDTRIEYDRSHYVLAVRWYY
jgi:hypothetical protein